MKRLLPITVACGVLLMLPDFTQAQTGGTGTLRITMGAYGRIRLATPGSGATRHLSRMSGVFALDSSAVFDYIEDSEIVEDPVVITGGIADTIITGLTDGTYALRLPNVTLRLTAYMWHGDNYCILRFTYRNDSTIAVNATIGAAVVPQPTGEFGFETVTYDTPSEVGYFYRTGQEAHIGLKVLSGPAYSFHSMDWEVYSPDPDNDYSNDSIRAFLTIPPGFDAPYEAGPVGAIFHHSAGMWTIQPGDSVTVDYALIYASSADSLFAYAAMAQQRHDSVLTSVEPVAGEMPGGFALSQNYPNPFNPSTQIRFDVPSESFVSLKVYDLLGREVATLVNQDLRAGTYSVAFNGEGLPSGTYIAAMSAAGHRATRKMLLMK
jgi:hypothetical protein